MVIISRGNLLQEMLVLRLHIFVRLTNRLSRHEKKKFKLISKV